MPVVHSNPSHSVRDDLEETEAEMVMLNSFLNYWAMGVEGGQNCSLDWWWWRFQLVLQTCLGTRCFCLFAQLYRQDAFPNLQPEYPDLTFSCSAVLVEGALSFSFQGKFLLAAGQAFFIYS